MDIQNRRGYGEGFSLLWHVGKLGPHDVPIDNAVSDGGYSYPSLEHLRRARLDACYQTSGSTVKIPAKLAISDTHPVDPGGLPSAPNNVSDVGEPV